MNSYVCGVEVEAEGEKHAELLIKEVPSYETKPLVCHNKDSIGIGTGILILIALLIGYCTNILITEVNIVE
jgi:hypothetical protein